MRICHTVKYCSVHWAVRRVKVLGHAIDNRRISYTFQWQMCARCEAGSVQRVDVSTVFWNISELSFVHIRVR